MKLLISIVFLTLLICHCRNQEYRLVEINQRNDLKEIRLGQTDYYLKLPDSLVLDESSGIEGQRGYSLMTKDTFPPRMYGFIEIDLGQPLFDKMDDSRELKEKVQSDLLNNRAVWKIYQTETRYYVATTSSKSIYSWVASKNKNYIDTLISLITTLKRKDR